MCKIFAMTDTSKVKVTNKLLNKIRESVCQYDNDGFGYSVANADGSVWGERTFKPDSFFMRINRPESITAKHPIVYKHYNQFGTYKENNNLNLIAHGRMSTNSVSLANTHPFVDQSTSLIHNGVVTDMADQPVKLTSTCDTEILLRYWLKGGIGEIEKHVSGYYAMAIQEDGYLYIIRDSRASLYMAWSSTVGSFIIATRANIITDVAKAMKWKIEHPEEIAPNIMCIFQGNTMVEHHDITPRAAGFVNDSRTARAFGESSKFYDSSRYHHDRWSYGIDDDGLSSSETESLSDELKKLEKMQLDADFDEHPTNAKLLKVIGGRE